MRVAVYKRRSCEDCSHHADALDRCQSIRLTAGPVDAKWNHMRQPCAVRSKERDATDEGEGLRASLLQVRRVVDFSA